MNDKSVQELELELNKLESEVLYYKELVSRLEAALAEKNND